MYKEDAEMYDLTKNDDAKQIIDGCLSSDERVANYFRNILEIKLRRLILKIANDDFPTFYEKKHDLIGAAWIDILDNLDKYDVNKGKASTFFTLIIKSAMAKEARKIGGDITRHYTAIARRINAARQELASENIKSPSITILANKTGVRASTILKVNEMMSNRNISLDTISSSVSDMRISADPQKLADQNELYTVLNEAVEKLPSIERKIIKAKYSSNCAAPSTNEIARSLNMTPRAVKQAEASALKRLRTTEKLKGLYKPNTKDVSRELHEDEIAYTPDELAQRTIPAILDNEELSCCELIQCQPVVVDIAAIKQTHE